MELSNEIRLGQVVLSSAGRDKGRVFLVADVVGPSFVKVVDGDLRKLDNPKLKKLKHLFVYNTVIPEFEDLLSNGMLFDADVRKLLKPYSVKIKTGGRE